MAASKPIRWHSRLCLGGVDLDDAVVRQAFEPGVGAGAMSHPLLAACTELAPRPATLLGCSLT